MSARAKPVKVGDSFDRVVTLDEGSIAAFATSIGDSNPLHHDRDTAARSRFGGIIASGPQTSSLMMGLAAAWFTARGESVGLEFSFRFRKALRAGQSLRLAWTITGTVNKPSLNGDLVSLSGSAVDGAGNLVIEADALALLAHTRL
jgi:3-hydroxybutyryl-CoA dehydratase